MADEWESLRRQAKKIERLLEEKVSAYSRLAQRMHSDMLYDEENPLMEGREEQSLAIEIETMLSSLSDCNDRMAQCVKSGARTANAALLQRYREIYFDFKRDFAETAGSIHRKREQVELFRGAAASKMKSDGEAHLYAEQEALSSSLRSAGSVIGQADEIRSALWSQRRLIESSGNALGSLSTQFPSIGRVIGSIQQRRYRDNMVVGLVISLCICFTLFWLFG
mmetsp:Transcript_36650/g.47330  ORF Transcript_36650/g.47330 Transcript_36650/m.47330 type:complete len:223 (+) Transcript_36650:208-876(+)